MSALHEEEFQHKKVEWKTWKTLLQFVLKYKKILILMIASMSVMGVIEVLMPYLTSFAIDNYIVPRKLDDLWKFILLYVGAILATGGTVFTFVFFAGKMEVSVTHDIRENGFDRLQILSYSYYDVTSVGYIMARLTSDAQKLGDTMAWSLVDLAWGAFFMLASLVWMMILNLKLALIIVCLVPFLAVISFYFQQKILKHQREVRKTNSRITGAFNEGIMGARTTKTLVREEQNYNDFSEITGRMRTFSVKAAIFSSLYMPVVMTLGGIGSGLILWQGGAQVVLGVGMTLGELVFFWTMSTFFFEPVYNAARIFAELQSAQASAERVVKLLNTEPEIKDSEAITKIYGDAFEPKKENWPEIHGEVEFKDVMFKYNKGEKVLDDFNLKIKSGETIALVGETGSGKSTIVNLICRFYEPVEGSILIDGVDYRERSQLWLHSNLGYVLQTPHLFSGTIMENIRYGRLDATDDEVIEASKLVDAHHFVVNLKDGYDTQVGEGGSLLSTGEKQLISFARAILADPALFVLDEATSSIDTETEVKIQTAIEKLLSGRTSFIIAHRLSTIRHADRILVIDKGKIIQEGTHKELMHQDGHYRDLYMEQFRHEAENVLLGINESEAMA
jgi:ATP-binding cassette subfamily B protein